MRSVFFVLAAVLLSVAVAATPQVDVIRLPEGGVQPQVAVDAKSVVHVVYLAGEASKADVFYIRSTDFGKSFTKPVHVNSLQGSAVAAGSIRGAQIAIGRGGRVHVAWNGSSIAKPKGPLNPEQAADSPYNGTPMLYSRLGEDGKFEPQRNLMTKTFGLDGGGTIAADARGNVYVAWHGKSLGALDGEAGRRVWVARSTDDGKTFAPESADFNEPTGACGCCGMRLFVDKEGDLLGLFRGARELIHRDVFLIRSRDRGKSFEGEMLHPWEIGACPMSSMFFSEGPAGVLAAWETNKQVYFSRIDPVTLAASKPVSAPVAPQAEGENRKYPVLVQNARGEVLMVWTVATGWGKPGKLAWQSFAAGGAASRISGAISEIPAWSFAAAFARPDGGFTILY